jgi:TRAP transporter TAXI family solute receptor
MGDGRADLFIHTSSYRQPNLVEIAERGNVGFLAIEEPMRDQLVQKYGFLKVEHPAGEFKNLAEPVRTVGFYTTVIAHKDLPEAVAYGVVKGVLENPDELRQAHASLKSFDPRQAAQPEANGHIPMHPGALRYFREKGWAQ